MRRPRHIEAARYARALRATTDRYLGGFMARATWGRHMRHLWDQIDACGLGDRVRRLVDPLTQRPDVGRRGRR